MNDDFYVGYEPQAPPAVRARIRRWVPLLFLAGLAAAAAFAVDQVDPGQGRYEFGLARTFEGRVESIPYPTLLVRRPGATDPREGYSRYPVVGFAKFGAGSALEPFEGQYVRLEAALVHRDGLTMLELVEGSVAVIGTPDGSERGRMNPRGAAREVTVEGEIVDSKCFLGAMKPGLGRTHKACAELCVRGGIPPLLVGVDGERRFVKALLVGPDGEALNGAVLPLIAEPVRMTGLLEERLGWSVLRVDPALIERVDRFRWI